MAQYCKMCKKEVYASERIRSTPKGIVRYVGCSEMGHYLGGYEFTPRETPLPKKSVQKVEPVTIW